jgi:hypothetical protein
MVSDTFPSPYDGDDELLVRWTDSGLAGGIRFAFAMTAAFNTTENSGLMPQAKHGGSGNDSVAIVGSKFEGTGFEKEQMGQTHVPATTGDGAGETAGARNGLAEREPGVDEDCTFWN